MDYQYRLGELSHTTEEHTRRLDDLDTRTDQLERQVSDIRARLMRGLLLAGLASGGAAAHLAPDTIAAKVLKIASIVSTP